MTQQGESITFERRELIAKLAAIGNRLSKNKNRVGEEHSGLTVGRIAAYITECGKEFDLTNEEQLLFLKYAVHGSDDVEELLKGDF